MNPDNTPFYFTQYTDANGYLRTVLSHKDDDTTGGHLMMIGSGSIAGIVELSSDLDGSGILEYWNDMEIYGAAGNLLKKVTDVTPAYSAAQTIAPDNSGDYPYLLA